MTCGACARMGTNDRTAPAHSPNCKAVAPKARTKWAKVCEEDLAAMTRQLADALARFERIEKMCAPSSEAAVLAREGAADLKGWK